MANVDTPPPADDAPRAQSEPVIQPLLPDGGGYVCYLDSSGVRGAYGTTPEEAREAWEKGILEDVGAAVLNKWRGCGYL